ncbi:MAG: O-antigen ligase family protein, partial [Patescibacteria group bacterium]
LVYLLIINLCRDKKSLDLILNSLFLGAFLMSVMAIVQRFTGWLVPYQYWYLGEGQRVTGFFGVPNFLSLYLGPIMGLLLGKIFFVKSKIDKQKIFYILTFALAFLAIFFAKSEGALVAVPGALFIFGLLNKKTRILSASIILIGVILYFSVPNIQSALLSRLDPSQNWSVFIRTQIWSESWQMLKDNWLLGAGLAGYQQAIVPYHTADYFEIFLYPHNLIMNFWSEMGLAGLILFLTLIIKFFVDSYKLIKQKIGLEYVWGVILAMLIFVIHGLVDHPYFKNDLSVIFWIIIAVLAWVKVDSQKMKT